MEKRNLTIFYMYIGGAFVLVGLFALAFAVYIEAFTTKGVSNQLAGLIAIPLVGGASLVKGAFDKMQRDDWPASKPPGLPTPPPTPPLTPTAPTNEPGGTA